MDHVHKRQRNSESATQHHDGYEARVLHGPTYRRNVSVRRVLHHRSVSRRFISEAETEIAAGRRPDLILCAYPTIELALASVRFGKRHDVPVVLDARDMWPDLFLDLAPRRLRGLVRPLLASSFRNAAEAMRDASAVTGITAEFVSWARGLAGLPPQPWDRAFHLCSSRPTFDAATLAAAGSYWDVRGVRDDGRPRLAFAGTMSSRMEHDAVLAAARRAIGPEAPQFVLCGAGQRLDALRAAVRDLPHVLLPGHVDAAAVRVLLRRSTFGLLPYPDAADFRMSLPNKVGEYLSEGLPIASSAPGTTARLLATEGCGFTYPNGDGGALHSQIRQWVADPSRLARARAAALRVYEDQFDAGRIYPEFASYLEAIAGRRFPPGVPISAPASPRRR